MTFYTFIDITLMFLVYLIEAVILTGCFGYQCTIKNMDQLQPYFECFLEMQLLNLVKKQFLLH